MKAACERYDQALLMLVHGALDPRQALFVRAHLALCPACRERRQRLEGVTRSFASVLANPRLGVRRLAGPSRTVLASVGLLAALFALLGVLASSKVAASSAAATPSPRAPVVSASHCSHRSCDTPSVKTKSTSAPVAETRPADAINESASCGTLPASSSR